jgi:diacylglycerol O-acyltransferase 1
LKLPPFSHDLHIDKTILENRIKNEQLGNVIFWVVFCIVGQPVSVLLYYHDYLLATRGSAARLGGKFSRGVGGGGGGGLNGAGAAAAALGRGMTGGLLVRDAAAGGASLMRADLRGYEL